MAEHLGEPALDPRQEVGLGDLAALEREQRVHAVVAQAVRHRLAVRLRRHVGPVLERSNAPSSGTVRTPPKSETTASIMRGRSTS